MDSPVLLHSVVSLTVVEMFSRMLGTAHSTGVSLVMVHDDRAGTFLCNYSPYLLIIFYLARSILQVDVGHNMGILCMYNAYVCIHPHSIPTQIIPSNNVVYQIFNQSIPLSGYKTNCVVVCWRSKLL